MGKRQADKTPTPPIVVTRLTHPQAFPVQLGGRDHLMLPAAIRKRLNLRKGDELVIMLQPDGALRLTGARQAANAARGLYPGLARGRSLADELIAERRAEAIR